MGKYSNETKTAVIEALRNGEDLAEVAGRFGVNRRTVIGWWRWQEKYELSPRHREFVNQYFLKNMNGTRAYMAVYDVEPKTAAVNASRLLRNTKISAVVDDRLQRSAMNADEVQYRLSTIGRGDLARYIGESGIFNLELLKEDGLGHLLKKHKMRKTITIGENGSVTENEWHEHELYDAQAALNTLAKIHGLTDKSPAGSEEDPIYIDLGAAINRALEKAYGSTSSPADGNGDSN